ncbi:CheR family methyltransferase [Ancylobacter pratisalsi]|uniref:CheR-type methyltransferase domain-containing protein n=1 Tax=Ancylobacter pratisalsi TaxID=1745854 RepID=A0A6P1YS61_9HYPH|nr:CheR family methyltransferase [Ancylobacter pratisalsi]QIB34544.1 hypothetical protein G3A50_13090 [Ancylobacter pratisalsi]
MLGSIRALFVERFGLLAATLQDEELLHRLITGLGPERISGAELEALLAQAAGQPFAGREIQLLIEAITIRETSLLRQLNWFEKLARHAVAPLVAARRAAGRRDITIWSAGCASGEEAYSVALILAEYLPDVSEWTIRIIGTDLCAAAIEAARRGVYQSRALREVSDVRRALHFRQHRHGFEVGAHLRAMVSFELCNLLDPESMPSAAFDLILCRNVLMHLEPVARKRVARNLLGRLAPHGVLVTAPSEATPELFHPLVRADHGELLLFQRTPLATTTPHMPVPLCPPDEPAGAPDIPFMAASPAPTPRDGIIAQLDDMISAGRLGDARRHCAQAMARAPLDTGLINLMATLQEMDGDHEGALLTLRRALRLNGSDGTAQLRLAALLRRHRGKKALGADGCKRDGQKEAHRRV